MNIQDMHDKKAITILLRPKENLNRSWRLLLSLAMPVYPGKICIGKRAMIRTIVWCRP